MKIGIDISSIHTGRGPGRYTSEILSALGSISTNNISFNLYSPFKDTLEALTSAFSFIHIPTEKHKPWLNWTLLRQTIKDKIDLMFFPANDCWLIPLKPTIVTLHDIAPVTVLKKYHKSKFDLIQVKLQHLFARFFAKKIVTVSNYSAGQLQTHLKIPHNKIEVIYNGISTPDSHTVSIRKPLLNTPYILYVGGFDKRKNLERLLVAYKTALMKNIHVKLVLIGKSGNNSRLYFNMPDLVSKYDLNENVLILNNVNDKDLWNYYYNARFFVFPSIIEGFGFPVLEAMSLNCPVLCSNATSIPEIAGDAAVYFDPLDTEDITAKLQELAVNDSLRQKVREQGQKQILKFSWNKSAHHVIRLIKETLKTTSGGKA